MAELPETRSGSSSGRPPVQVDMTEVNQLITMGFSKTKIAELLGISCKTLNNKTSSQSIEAAAVIPKYTLSDITDTELDSKIMSIKH